MTAGQSVFTMLQRTEAKHFHFEVKSRKNSGGIFGKYQDVYINNKISDILMYIRYILKMQQKVPQIGTLKND